MNIQNTFVTHKDLDKELAGLLEMCNGELGIHASKSKGFEKLDEDKKIYQFKKICRRLEIKVIYTKPIFGNVEILSVHPIMN